MPIAAGGRNATLQVLLGLTANPLDALSSITWTDITQWIEAFEYQGGRQHELNRVEASTATLRMNNRDRRFDATNTAGPYYPNLKTMRRLRIVETWGDSHNAFTGYLLNKPPSWPSATSSTVELRAADALHLFALGDIRSSAYRDAVLALGPHLYYRMGDAPGSIVAADSSGNGLDATYLGPVGLGAGGALVTDTDGAVDLTQSPTMVLAPLGAPPAGAVAFSVAFWAKGNPTQLGTGPFDWRDTPYTNEFRIDVGSTLLMQPFYSSGSSFFAFTNVAGTKKVIDGNWHFVVWTRATNGTTNRLYVDGVLQATQTAGFTLSIQPNSTLRVGDITGDSQLSIDEFAIFTSELTGAQILNLYNAGVGVWGQQSSGQRINTILDAMGWPAADRAIDPGRSVLQAVTAPLTSTKWLDHLQSVADTEDGRLFIDGSGRVVFHDRSRRLSAPYTVSQATFGDGPSELHYVAGGLQIEPDEEVEIRNEITAQRAGGSPQVAVDATSKAAYGQRTYDKTGLLAATDVEVWDRANWDLTQYKDPHTRIRSMTIEPVSDPSNLWPQALGRQPDDRVSILARPVGGGPAFSQDSVIEGYHHAWDPATSSARRSTFMLSPAPPNTWWVLGTGLLGSSTVLAY